MKKSGSSLPRRLLALGVGAALVVTGATTTVLSQDIKTDVQHFWQCFGWMITDPDTHAANCLPGRASGDSDPVSYSSDDGYSVPSGGDSSWEEPKGNNPS